MGKWILVNANELSQRQIDEWRELIVCTSHFTSPFYSPDYVQLVSRFMSNVQVGMLYSDERLDAVFPFERVQQVIAGPVGRELCDYQGPIYRDSSTLDPLLMLQALGLNQYRFDHLYPASGPLRTSIWSTWPSLQISFEPSRTDTRARFRTAHKKLVHSLGRKQKKLSQDLGSVRLMQNLVDPELLDRLLTWKCDQYERTQRSHPFRNIWARDILKAGLQLDDEVFRGRMSALMAGEHVIALEYSLETEHVSHMLICAHGPEYSKYSPGLMRNAQLIEQGPTLDSISLVDFGKGLEEYKQSFSNATVEVAEGCVDRSRLRSYLNAQIQRSRYRFLRSRWSEPIRQLARASAVRMPVLRRLLSMR